MGVFRADEDPKEGDLEQPEEGAAPYEPGGSAGENAEAAERDRLNDRAGGFDSGELRNSDTPYGLPERRALQQLQDPEPEEPEENFADRRLAAEAASADRGGPRRSMPGFGLEGRKKQVAAGLGFLLVPTLVGLLLLIFAVQAGLALEHVTRVTTGLRFGSMHYQPQPALQPLAQRVCPPRRLPGRLDLPGRALHQNDPGQQALGVHPEKILYTLRNNGWELHYSYSQGHALTKGRWTLTGAVDPGGNVRSIKSAREASEFIRQSWVGVRRHRAGTLPGDQEQLPARQTDRHTFFALPAGD